MSYNEVTYYDCESGEHSDPGNNLLIDYCPFCLITRLEAENERLREAILKYLRDSNLAAREELRRAALEVSE